MIDKDIVYPFQIESGAFRGRLVRLGPALDRILSDHGYPLPVAQLLAEALVLAASLANALKYDGIFTLQIKGDGPISLLVADITSGGDVRGYARFDQERLNAIPNPQAGSVACLLGRGYLAFTVDQGADTDRYQGIIELAGETLAACVQDYFRISEQIDTAIGAFIDYRDDHWQAASLMVQRMPAGRPAYIDLSTPPPSPEEDEDEWRRVSILMESATAKEMLDADLAGEKMLFRLFHADRLVVFPPKPLQAKCRCSSERVEGTLRSFPREEIASMKTDQGIVEVICEFCQTHYSFTDADLDRVFQISVPIEASLNGSE